MCTRGVLLCVGMHSCATLRLVCLHADVSESRCIIRAPIVVVYEKTHLYAKALLDCVQTRADIRNKLCCSVLIFSPLL